jgi:uncharacterized protein GlcG (DUF336 family)
MAHTRGPAFQKSSISLAAALEAIDAARAKAEEMAMTATIAIVDEAGTLKAAVRMDGAPLISLDVAIDKAYTAASSLLPTDEMYDALKLDPAVYDGVANRPRIAMFGGGLPIQVAGATVGAIGVSGGAPYQDREVAEAGRRRVAP